MPLLRYDEYRPDVSDYEGTASRLILNAIPQGDGYGPFPGFSAYTATLPGPCMGAFYALKNDGTVITFAATATKLYQLNNTTYTWTDVSLGAGSYANLATGAQWQFAQTGNLVFATQANAALQVFDMTSSSAFANALGSPPQAAYIAIVGGFIVLSGLSTLPYRVAWSGLNNFNSATSWTFGVGGSDFQDFADGGIVRGVAGGDQSGIIFQDQTIRSLAYVPGSPLIFQIDRIAQGMGLFAPYSIIKQGSTVFFYAGQGFYKIEPGSTPIPIGRERVDRTFIADLDKANLQLFMGAGDPRSSRIYWAYKSNSGGSGFYDKLLGFDPVLDRWFPVQASGEYLLGISQTGLTLAALDPIAPTPLTITGAANNGAGKIRLTLAAESNSNFNINNPQQNFCVVYGVTGTTEANGVWGYTIIDATHIDLIGSTFTNAYVSGGKIGGSLAAMTLSLDSYATAVQPQLGQFDTIGTLGFFSGSNLQATLQTGEQGTDAQRLFVRGFRPITDAPTPMGSIFYRDQQNATPIQSVEVGLSRIGRFDIRRDTRYARFQTRMPAGMAWSFLAGIVPDADAGAMQ